MTTMKRYPIDPFRMLEEDFLDHDGERVILIEAHERCHMCGTEIGHMEDGFVEFWHDAATDEDLAWCDMCAKPGRLTR